MANTSNSLAHTKWMCKYHIVFTPKYRRKMIYIQYKESIGKILRDLCGYKGVERIEGHLMIYVASNSSDTPARVKIRTPSFVNIPSIRAMVKGQYLAVTPLIQAPIYPCCPCTDR